MDFNFLVVLLTEISFGSLTGAECYISTSHVLLSPSQMDMLRNVLGESMERPLFWVSALAALLASALLPHHSS